MAKEVALEILKILEENTDKNHKLSKKEILQKLADDYDTFIEEKSFLRKIKELKAAKFNVQNTEGRSTKYYLNDNKLNKDELLYVSMMILGSDLLSEKESDDIVKSLNSMSVHKKDAINYDKYKRNLSKNNSQTNRVKNFSVFMQGLESKTSVKCKRIVSYDNGQYVFSDYLNIQPFDFSIEKNEMILEYIIDSKKERVNLKELIDLEII